MIFPSSVFLAFHIPSLIRPGRVWGVWAQGWSHMARVGLWFLGGLRCEDWSIAWWDCHLFCREYRDWYCMMRVGLWWAVAWWDHRLLCFERIIFEIIMEHLEYGLAHDSRGLTRLYQIDIDFRYRSFKALRAWCFRLWLKDGWPSFWLTHTLLPLLTSRPLLALWALHEHHSLLFLIALLIFYTGIGAL